jgi:hypothetical protein
MQSCADSAASKLKVQLLQLFPSVLIHVFIVKDLVGVVKLAVFPAAPAGSVGWLSGLPVIPSGRGGRWVCLGHGHGDGGESDGAGRLGHVDGDGGAAAAGRPFVPSAPRVRWGGSR